MVPWTHKTRPLKRHLDRFSRFCRAHTCDQQTDRHTDICSNRPLIHCVHAMRSNNVINDKFIIIFNGNHSHLENHLMQTQCSINFLSRAIKSYWLCTEFLPVCHEPVAYCIKTSNRCPEYFSKRQHRRLLLFVAANAFVRPWPHLLHDSLGPPESATQTASRSVQPFVHGTPEWPTHRQTDHATCDICNRSLLLKITNRKWYMDYWIAAIPVTLSDIQGHSPTANLFKWDFSYSCV